MLGQDRAGEIVETDPAVLADIALTPPLRFIMAVARDMPTAAFPTLHALRPTSLTNEFETFGFVEQARKIDENSHGSNHC